MSIRLLEHMRDELIATGIVQNTPEFCHSWLGRSEGYIRVLRYHNHEPSVGTLGLCSSKLGYYAARLAASDQHDAIISAIENRDEASAAELATDHWNLSRHQIELFVMPGQLDIPLGTFS